MLYSKLFASLCVSLDSDKSFICRYKLFLLKTKTFINLLCVPRALQLSKITAMSSATRNRHRTTRTTAMTPSHPENENIGFLAREIFSKINMNTVCAAHHTDLSQSNVSPRESCSKVLLVENYDAEQVLPNVTCTRKKPHLV